MIFCCSRQSRRDPQADKNSLNRKEDRRCKRAVALPERSIFSHDSAVRIASAGQVIFAVTMIALGIMGLKKGDFSVIWQPVPKGLPGREMLVYLCALISLASGIGLLLQRTAAVAARVLFLWFLLWLLFLRLPGFSRGFTVDVYWAACQTAVMLAAAWVLYTWFATDWDKQGLGFVAGENGLRIARVLYGLALIPFGLAHFSYLKQTAVLVPGWLPWHVAWAYLYRRYFHRGGRRDNRRNLCTARSGTFDFADGIVPSADMDTQGGGRFIDTISAG